MEFSNLEFSNLEFGIVKLTVCIPMARISIYSEPSYKYGFLNPTPFE